ncbi:MAG: 3-dehydro-L-gulonate 2-dehydrogenase [Sphaerochaetaceae bacterium]
MRIARDEMKAEFKKILISRGFDEKGADDAAEVFTSNSVDGIYSHGVNRFPRVVSYLDHGTIKPENVPTVVKSFFGFERWDGHRGFGPLNARRAMDRACDLSEKYGIGVVALGNNNHWMRGGSYGWQAADRGKIGICWSNTQPNMPAWGGIDKKIGNCPFIMAVPRSDGRHMVVDMAVSQFSYGKIEEYKLKGKQLPVYGGYDTKGNLTTDPTEIEKSWRVLPMGYWKGSGFSIMLDAVATVLSMGNSVEKIGTFGDEVGLTQIMIAIDPSVMNSAEETDSVINAICDDVTSSVSETEGGKVFYPGQIEWETRKDNLEHGIPVIDEVWRTIKELEKKA